MIYFTVTIDVEPDCTPTWHYSNPLRFDGVKIGIKERLQPLFNKYDIVPTYLINNVVLEDRESISVFKNLEGNSELGTHLHPEFIEPDKSVFNYAGSKGEANCCFYPPDIEFGKIQNITGLFEQQFGYRPTSFRAGRFSAKENTLKSLAELGYKVDTSVTPHINWNDKTRESPVDYTAAPEQPYFFANESISNPSQTGRILEVPVSIAKMRHLFWQRSIWLRPIYSTYGQLIHLINHFYKKYKSNDTIVFNMMFHNIEVVPCKSPYTKSEDECVSYLKTVEKFLLYCKGEGVKSKTLCGLYEIYAQKYK